jgi:hypothetical protein
MIRKSSAPARAPRHRLTRRLFATGVAVLLAAGGAAPASAATPSPSPSTPVLSGEIDLTLSPLSNGILRPGQPLPTAVRIDNGTAESVTPSEVTLELGADPLPDRGALSAWLSAPSPDGLPAVGSAPVEAIPSGEDATASIVVAPEDPALAARVPGVYPLRASTIVDGDRIVSTSVVIVPDDAVAASVGVIVPITAPPGTAGLLSIDDLALLTAADGALTAQLDAVEGTAAILAIDPAVVAAIRARGTTAPATAIEWLTRLEALPNARFALQYADADLTPQMQAGLPAPLQPTSLAAYVSAQTIPEPQTPAATPTPGTENAGEPQLPDLAQLTSVEPDAFAGVLWPATGTAGADVVAALGGTTVAGAPSLTLVPSATTSAGEGDRTTRARATATGAQLLVYDTGVSAALDRAAGEGESSRRGAPLAEATAHLAFAARESGGQPLLVTVDRGTDRERLSLRAAITAATLAPGVTPVGMTELAAAEPIEVSIAEIPADAARVGELTQMLAGETEVANFATILDDPALLTGRQRAEVLQLLAVGWRDDPEAAATAFTAHRERTRETLDAVGILPSSVLNLISYDANFGPWVRNDLPYPVNLELVAQPNDPRLIVAERTPVSASAASNTRVTIPVQARVGSGTVIVTMQLYSPTGVPIGAVQSAEVEVRAEWETIGLIILVSLMVLFFGLGIVRTVRRRRARALEDTEATLGPEVRADDGPPRR